MECRGLQKVSAGAAGEDPGLINWARFLLVDTSKGTLHLEADVSYRCAGTDYVKIGGAWIIRHFYLE